MKLSDLKFNVVYNSYKDNIIDDFYVKALSCSTNYDRVSAYFDARILSLYSIGLAELAKNKGKIRFIFSCELTEEDFDIIKQGYEKRIEKKLLEQISFDNLTDIDIKRISNLAYLIENGIADIKIAFTRQGLFHDKFGLIYGNDDYLYFRGSNNETTASILYSYESFETSCSWNDEKNESEKINSAINTFNILWNNRHDKLIVIDIPTVIKDKLISFNNGNLIFERDIEYYNSIILDLNENEQLIAMNYLSNEIDISKDWTYRNFIKKYIDYESNETIYFKIDLSYLLFEKIINMFLECSSKNNFNCNVTQKLRDFIKNKNLEIEKRKNLGIDIKNRNTIVIPKFEEFKSIVNNEMHRPLREKQMWDAFHIVSMWKDANFSVPGAGKTSIVYGAFAYLNSKTINKVDKIIMIGPKNSFMAWKDEFVENFGIKKELKIIDIQDNEMFKTKNQKISELRFESHNKNLILVNYDMLNSLEEVLLEIINPRTMLVFDEAHKIKAINGKRAVASLKICQKAKYKIVLTGTPLPNSYQDIYNMLNILFTDEYKTYFKYMPNQLVNPTETLMAQINERIYPFYCRTTKKDLNIPHPNPDYVDKVLMNSKEKELFELLRRKYHGNILTLYIRLLQASTNPMLLLKNIDENQIMDLFSMEDDEDKYDNNYLADKIMTDSSFTQDEINLINSIGKTGKFNTGIELIKKLVSEKKQVIAWGIFIDTLNNIVTELKNSGINCVKIDGSVPQADREKYINQFKNGEISVIITNPHTLAESVSLHKNCHDAVYFEYSFNLTHMLQSRDRINRLGLPEGQYTQYYYLMLSNDNPDYDSIDERTYFRLKEKEEIMIKTIEGTSLGRIDFDDLEDIKRILKDI